MSKNKSEWWWIIYRFSWFNNNKATVKQQESNNIKKPQKTTINPIHDNDKYFEYVATGALNHEEIVKSSKEYQKLRLLSKIWLERNVIHQKKMITGKSLRKMMQEMLLMCYKLKNEYIFCLHFKTQLKLWKTNYSFNDSKWERRSWFLI